MAKAAKAASSRKRTPRKGAASLLAEPMGGPDRESVNVEKITNGYVVERSGTKAGRYFSEKAYSETNPLKMPAKGKV